MTKTLVLAAASCVLAVLPAQASTTSDTVNLKVSDYQQISSYMYDGSAEGLTQIAQIGLLNQPVQVLFTESGDQTYVSDILLLDSSGIFWFESDDQTSLTGYAGYTTYSTPETGLLQDVSHYFGLPEGTITVQSDVEAVPEPTTIIAGALLLLPFGASTLRILRRNRAA